VPSAHHSESPAEECLLRKEQVAAVFNVSPRTVTYWAWTGKLASVRTPGGQYRFRPSVIAARLAQAEAAA
jgi:excisionase family DNA binding protein